jgi:hypothetical protein
VIGVIAAFRMGIYQDSMMIIVAIITDVLLLRNKNEAEDVPGKVEGEG